MAPAFVACRICYSIEGRLKNYKSDGFYIEIYEKLTGCPFIDLPYINKFCPQCACLMKKLEAFKKRCRSSYESLVEWLDTGRKITKPYIQSMSKCTRRKRPVNLSCWTAEHTSILDCKHFSKKYKAKQKVDEDFYVSHITVPKDEAAEIPQKKVHETRRQDVLDSEYSLSDSDIGADSFKEETLEVPVASEAICLEPAAEEVKMEDGLDKDILEDATEQKEIEVKLELERDPDSLTLQQIKEELQCQEMLQCQEIQCENEQCANDTDVNFLSSEQDVNKKKGTKKKDKNQKLSKQTERLLLRASRIKSNQALEENFTITLFLTEEEQIQEFLKRREGEGYLEGRFKCELCLKSFKEQKWMATHVKKHETSAGTYVCNICKIRCRTPKLFRTHRDANHTTRYSCKRCPFVTYSKAQALKHHGWHEGVEHACQHCGATFRKHTTYMGHLRRAHPSSFICGVCARSFVSAYGLNLHMKAVHKDIHNLEFDSTRCEECDVTFVSHKMYIRHILITDKHKEMSKDILGCRKCGEHFESREEMEKHTHYKERKYIKTDAPKRSIKCDQCEEVFSHPNGVYQHYLREHPDKPYQFAIQRHYLCEQCGKTFKSPGLLQQHSLIHKGLRPPTAKKKQGRNSCRLCGKTYSKLSGLFRHKLTHQGVRRHKCHICDKAFTDTSNLKQHVQGVHLNIRRVRKR